MTRIDERNTVIPEAKKISNSFWGFFIFNRKMAITLGLIFLITGVFSFFKLPRETDPEVVIPYATVVTTYPGASPQEVSEQVTFEIEQRLQGLEDLEELTSTSSEGVSSIFVEFDAKADIDDSIRKLKDKVDEAKSGLPEDANDPFVQEISSNSQPIVTFSFFGNLPYEQMLNVVEDVQDEIEKINGVQSAAISGKRGRHLLVAVDKKSMMQYGLNLRTIGQAISSFHLNSPVGNIEIDNLSYRVRIEADQEDATRIKNIPIETKNGALIYIKDVADVNEEFYEASTMSRVSKHGESSKPALSINIIKKTGANVIRTVDQAKEIIHEMEENHLIPEEMDYIPVFDMAKYIKDDFNRLSRSALQTVFLIFIVLLIALGFKEAFIGGIAIPFTFLVAFTYLYQTGQTFNFLVLFSLILGLGLLVDATIVIMEGIHEFLHTRKMTPINAALMAVKTYRYPLMSGLLTTIAAFTPMLLMSGIMGQYFKYIPITVNAVLISAFFIGLFIIPAYTVLLMKKSNGNGKEIRCFAWLRHKRQHIVTCINKKYKRFLSYLLSARRRRIALYAISIIAFASALALPAVGLVKVEGFPLADIDFMYINAKAPVGTSIERMSPIMAKVEDMIQHDPDIDSYVLNIGSGGVTSFEGPVGSGSTSSHLATMSINFVDKKKRTVKSYETAAKYKKLLKQITEADITVPELRSGPPTGATIQVRVFGDDYSILKNISNDIKSELKVIGGDQVGDDLVTGTAEFTFDFSNLYQKALLKNHGLNVMDVAREVRMAVYPTKVATIKRGDEEINVDVQNNWGDFQPSSIDEVKLIPVQNYLGQYVNLGDLVQPRIGASLTSIRHFDSEQAITVSSDISPDLVPADVLKKLVPYLDSYDWPVGYSYQLTGGNEDTQESFMDLFKAMGLAVLLIMLILITQFNSFKQPFVILMALPLSMIGVLYGFMIFRLNVGVATMIGIVALSGIVINDAIVLIDRININRRENGMSLKEAIEEAGPARLQPIIITSVTTILGILPISLTDPFWLTLGMAIVFGMAFSTILTLIIIPSIYYSFEFKAEKKLMIKN